MLLAVVLVSVPAFAQVDFSGNWAARFYEDATDRGGGPDIGDYVGLPLNDAARMRGDTWSASMFTLPEWQCRPHGSDYIWRGPQEMRIWKDVDPVTREITAFNTEWLRSMTVPVYLDGRPHPPAWAPHTWWGFKTAEWVGDMLKVTVTHVKENYMKRNGLARSDLATLNEFWIRRDNWLTIITVVDDPVFLTEPLVRSTHYELDVHQQIPPYPCDVVEEVERAKGAVPHWLPGTNPDLRNFSKKYGVPFEATRDGAATMYPEYLPKLRKLVQGAGKEEVVATGTALLGARQDLDFTDGDIHVWPVRGAVYLLVGAGGNITESAGRDGALLVDTGTERMTDKVLAALRQLQQQLSVTTSPHLAFGSTTQTMPPLNSHEPPRPVRFIINTQADSDHTGGNAKIYESGKTFTGGNVTVGKEAPDGASIIAHDNVLKRMSAPAAGQPPSPFNALPAQTYRQESMKLSYFFNGEGIQIIHLPAAHTDGDSIVHFRYSDVISTGDVFTPARYPIIDVERGGSIQGTIDGLNRILDLAIPEFRLEGGTMIVPGHGRVCDATDVGYYRDMVTIVRDRIQDLIAKGMTLAQIKAARPTLDYDTRYGGEPGSAQTFVETVFRSLSEKKK